LGNKRPRWRKKLAFKPATHGGKKGTCRKRKMKKKSKKIYLKALPGRFNGFQAKGKEPKRFSKRERLNEGEESGRLWGDPKHTRGKWRTGVEFL